MGYRNYLYKIKKTKFDYKKIEKYGRYREKYFINLYELGKDVDDELIKNLIYIEKYDDCGTEFSIIDIESIPIICSNYARKHLIFLKRLIDEKHDKSFWYIKNPDDYVKDEIIKWENPESFIYNKNKTDNKIVESWEFQYEIFELLHIYKTFDDKKYYLIWQGY